MKRNYNTLRRRVGEGQSLTVKDIIHMAALFDVEPVAIFRLALFDLNAAAKPLQVKKR